MVERGYVGLLFGGMPQSQSGTFDRHADIMSKISFASQAREERKWSSRPCLKSLATCHLSLKISSYLSSSSASLFHPVQIFQPYLRYVRTGSRQCQFHRKSELGRIYSAEQQATSRPLR